MDYLEAKRLGEAWTKDQDTTQDGWRSVIAILLQRTTILEDHIQSLNQHCKYLSNEVQALSLDLGIKERNFNLPPQPQLKTIADIIKECEQGR